VGGWGIALCFQRSCSESCTRAMGKRTEKKQCQRIEGLQLNLTRYIFFLGHRLPCTCAFSGAQNLDPTPTQQAWRAGGAVAAPCMAPRRRDAALHTRASTRPDDRAPTKGMDGRPCRAGQRAACRQLWNSQTRPSYSPRECTTVYYHTAKHRRCQRLCKGSYSSWSQQQKPAQQQSSGDHCQRSTRA
jgi:hypothetical protein